MNAKQNVGNNGRYSLRKSRSRDRKSTRLRNYSYSQAGYYFVTICTQNRVNYFGEIDTDRTKLSGIGQIAMDCWCAIPEHFDNAGLDEFVVMPNHIHGIIVIKQKPFMKTADQNVGNSDRFALPRPRNMELLSKIISQYKSSVTRILRKQSIDPPFHWQSSFYDRVIRDDESLDNIRTYMRNNPLNWASDEENPANHTMHPR